jgi:tetratricopeptide (TPR) repeat protein
LQNRIDSDKVVREIAVRIPSIISLKLTNDKKDLPKLLKEANLAIASEATKKITDAGYDLKQRNIPETLPPNIMAQVKPYTESIEKLTSLSKTLGDESQYNTKEEIDMAELMMAIGNYDKAISHCDSVLTKDKSNVEALIVKGNAIDKKRKFEQALECYDKALKIDPKNITALVNKALTLEEIDSKNDEIKSLLEKAITLDSTTSNTMASKGTAYLTLGKFEQALECYDKALKIDPKNIIAVVNSGVAWTRLGYQEKAISYYDRVITQYSGHLTSLYNKSCSLCLLGEIDDCLNLLKSVISVDAAYKEKALKDIDFKGIKNDERFKKIVS